MTAKQPLSETHPELAKQAVGWDPSAVTAGSGQKVEWECPLGHNYLATVKNRTHAESGCPYCSGRSVLPGFNDFATKFPELAKEAHGWDPTKVVAGSEKELNWICAFGHIWSARANSRKRAGCPYCAGQRLIVGTNDLLTKNPILASELQEIAPTSIMAHSNFHYKWKCLHGHVWEASASDRMQGNGCPYCAGKKVAPRFNDLLSLHPKIASELLNRDPSTVLAGTHEKFDWQCESFHVWTATVVSRTSKKSGCPYCSNQSVKKGYNDLTTTDPAIAFEAFGWDPTTVVAGNDKKQKWQCSFGHLYSTSPYLRKRGDGCPYCSNHQLLKGFNDLGTVFPGIASEAEDWDPTTALSGSHKKAKWKCENGHIWIAVIKSRTGPIGAGCPSCAKNGFDPNENGWLYFLTHPQWGMLQVGITNFPDDRIKSHSKLGWELIELRGPMDGLIAREWETSILQMLKRHGAKLAPKEVVGKFDGYTEAWTTDSSPADSLKHLMELVRQDEDKIKMK